MTATRSLMRGVGLCVLLTAVGLPTDAATAVTIGGSPGRDVLVGTEGRDRIRGGAGADAITARGGVDVARGGEGDDLILMGRNKRGQEHAYGGPGTTGSTGTPATTCCGGAPEATGCTAVGTATCCTGDLETTCCGAAERAICWSVWVMGGNDVYRAGPGSDELDEMGAGRDRAYLGPGNDIATVEADGVRDVIDCGPGRHDEVFFGEADPLDEFIDCETVQPF